MVTLLSVGFALTLLVLFVLSPIIMLIEGSFNFYYLILCAISLFVLYLIFSSAKKSDNVERKMPKQSTFSGGSSAYQQSSLNYEEELADFDSDKDWFEMLFGELLEECSDNEPDDE